VSDQAGEPPAPLPNAAPAGAGGWLRHVLVLVLAAELVLAAVAAIQAWPAVSAAAKADNMPVLHLLGVFHGRPNPEAAFLIIVLLFGAIGAGVHALSSLTTYLGNGTFLGRWTWWYLIRTPIGATVALLLYLVLRGGLISADSPTSVVNPYAVSAVAGLSGMFAKNATDKLQEIFVTLFRTAGGGDAQRADKVIDFRVDTADPARMTAGEPGGPVVLRGVGFGSGTTATVGGAPRALTYVSTTEVRVTLTAQDLADPGLVRVTLHDTASRGNAVAVIDIPVDQPASSPATIAP